MKNKTQIAIFLFLVFFVLYVTACQQDMKKQPNENKEMAQKAQTAKADNISNALDDVANVDSDLNIEEANETDASLADIQNI